MLSIEHSNHLLQAVNLIGWDKIKEILLRLKNLNGYYALRSLRVKLDEKTSIEEWEDVCKFAGWAEDNNIKTCLTFPTIYPCNMGYTHDTKASWIKSSLGDYFEEIFEKISWWTINQPWIHGGSSNDFTGAKQRLEDFLTVFPVEKYLHTITYNCPSHWINLHSRLAMTIYLKTWELDKYQTAWEKYFELRNSGDKQIILNETNVWLGKVQDDGTIKFDFSENLWLDENIAQALKAMGHNSMVEGNLVWHPFIHTTRWGFLFINLKTNQIEIHPLLKKLIGNI